MGEGASHKAHEMHCPLAPLPTRSDLTERSDSVGKGGAQVAVECMNLMFGLPRSAGLERRSLHP